VQSVCNGQDTWRLGTVVVTALLSSVGQEDHPVYRAAKADREFFNRIARVADAGGEAAHDEAERRRRGASALSRDAVQTVIEDVYRVIRALSLPSESTVGLPSARREDV
jgi:hypothetical protein